MTAETNSTSKPRLLLLILGVAAMGLVVRVTFVDALTKLTGTWMGGVESPHRDTNDTNGSSAA